MWTLADITYTCNMKLSALTDFEITLVATSCYFKYFSMMQNFILFDSIKHSFFIVFSYCTHMIVKVPE